jgi:hypothetical protein
MPVDGPAKSDGSAHKFSAQLGFEGKLWLVADSRSAVEDNHPVHKLFKFPLDRPFNGRVAPTNQTSTRPHRRAKIRRPIVMATTLRPVSWQRMSGAVENVRRRLLRAATPLAVVGGNAVAAWVSRAAEAAVRNTRDVDLLLRREDLSAATAALEKAGFHHRRVRTETVGRFYRLPRIVIA